jgi:acetyl esterase
MSILFRVARPLARGALSLPLFGQPPRNDRGTVLDAQTHAMLRVLARGAPRFEELGPQRARREMSRQAGLGQRAPREVRRVEDHDLGQELRVRVYVPHVKPSPLPATVYYHGGGFVIGDLESHDSLCRQLAAGAETVVVAVHYRRAPEHPFPAAVEDAVRAFEWVVSCADALGIDASRVAVAGDSAGGNLAAVVSQQLRAASARPCFQLLIYPAVDLSRSFESHRTLSEGYMLTRSLLDWFVGHYLTEPAQLRDPRASPMVTADLEGLAPAHVVVAGFDPLRDEGEAYAEALRAAGVDTTSASYDALIHGFVSMDGVIDAAAHAVSDVTEVLRRRLWLRATG